MTWFEKKQTMQVCRSTFSSNVGKFDANLKAKKIVVRTKKVVFECQLGNKYLG